ncbi:MAG: cbb3-type cytochrome c oxidase subunit I [Planctomycetes bacterium]|nr:cbb3-type cytochrome c oxidase subunit I [Planctomycetota bacterium]
MSEPCGVRRYATLTFMRGALVSLLIALLGGVLGVLHYLPQSADFLRGIGLGFPALRPLHTTFVSAWIFLAALAVIHRWLEDAGGPVSEGERWRLRIQVSLWALAGAGIAVTLLLGITSGREYLGFHPLFSIPILLGWLLFAWNYFRVARLDFWNQPIYVSMWGVGVCFFTYTFLEQHAWLLPGVFSDPIVDLRIQWKACGTLVGSFNLLVYGSLYYVGERLSGDKRPARSRLAYALFAVGLLNSFTNYAHHTYHLPQRELVKWISFAISMTEIVILARVIWDLARSVAQARSSQAEPRTAPLFVMAAKWWTGAMLFTSLLISVPPLNTLIHGTQVVLGHAMGTEIGIDSMVLFAGIFMLLSDVLRRRGLSEAPLQSLWIRRAALGFNLAAAALVVWLHVWGIAIGVTRYQGLPPPIWIQDAGPYLLIGFGLCTAGFLVLLIAACARHLFAPTRQGSASPPRMTTREPN